jgi:hypothetical protein
MQTASPGTYTGAIDVVRKTIAADGIKGFVSHLSTFRGQADE